MATAFEFERSEEFGSLVAECVSGKTMADNLNVGPIAIDEALPILSQIVEGLEAGQLSHPCENAYPGNNFDHLKK